MSGMTTNFDGIAMKLMIAVTGFNAEFEKREHGLLDVCACVLCTTCKCARVCVWSDGTTSDMRHALSTSRMQT